MEHAHYRPNKDSHTLGVADEYHAEWLVHHTQNQKYR